MKRKWQKLGTRPVYDSGYFKVVEDKVIRPDGTESNYGVVETDGAVFVVAITTEGKYIFVVQHRYPIDKDTIEVVAGMLPAGKDPIAMAIQELKEEINVETANLLLLGQMFSNPSRTRSPGLFVTLARDVDTAEVGHGNQEGNEAINDILVLSGAEVVAKISSGEINDANTLAALNLYWSRFGTPKT